MVEQEIDNDLLKLTSTQYGPKDPRLGGLLDDGSRALALRFLQLWRHLKPTDRGRQSVELPELGSVIAKGIQRSDPPPQLKRFRDRFGMKLLGNVAVDPNRPDMVEVFERRAEGEPVQDVNNLAIDHGFGVGGLKHRQTDHQTRRRENPRTSRRHEIWLPPRGRIRKVCSCASMPDPKLRTLWPWPRLSPSSDLRSTMENRLIRGIGALAPRYDGLILDLWGVVHDGVAPLPGALECLRALIEARKRVVLLSNAPRRSSDVVDRISRIGVPAALYHDVMSSGE